MGELEWRLAYLFIDLYTQIISWPVSFALEEHHHPMRSSDCLSISIFYYFGITSLTTEEQSVSMRLGKLFWKQIWLPLYFEHHIRKLN